jgi:glycosyltransferase involved in cell wall biosynthesis
MKVLVNAIPLVGLSTGISRYVRQLYMAFEQLHDEEAIYFDGNRVRYKMPDQAEPEKWSRQTAAIWKLPDPLVFTLRSAHWLKFEWMLRRACRKHNFDVYHETGFVPAAMTAIPTVYTIHDLTLITHPCMHPRERVWFHEFFRKRRMRYAAHILTVSEFMQQEICDILDLKPEQVTAVPEAPAPHFWHRSPEAIQRVRQNFSLPQEYLLFVGSLEPRKNLPRIIQAMERCKMDIPLVLAGWEGWGDKTWMETIRGAGLEERIFVTGYVDDETLTCLYSGATALVYPSLYEGFGLPILEAMACGCPVICSNVASMPEVAGDAAFLVDPFDAEDLAAAVDKIVGDQAIRQHLIAKGFARASAFTWKQTAEKTRDVFLRVAQEGYRR